MLVVATAMNGMQTSRKLNIEITVILSERLILVFDTKYVGRTKMRISVTISRTRIVMLRAS